MTFDHSSLRWLGISDLIAEPEGPSFISRTVAHRRTHDGTRDTRPIAEVEPDGFLGAPGIAVRVRMSIGLWPSKVDLPDCLVANCTAEAGYASA
jgi:hypothetical protein